ncbi:Pilus assembly protein, PilO [compost metagenome]
MNKFFEILASYSYGKALVFSLALGGFYYMTLYDDGSALDARIAEVSRNLTQEEAKKVETDAALRQVKEMQEKVGQLSVQYQEISRRLPQDLFSIDINKAIDSFARNAGVSIKSKKPNPNVKTAVVEEVPVQVELEGSYAELVQFVYYVSSAERLSRVKNVVITEATDRSAKKLKFAGEVVGYKLAPEPPADGAETKQ